MRLASLVIRRRESAFRQNAFGFSSSRECSSQNSHKFVTNDHSHLRPLRPIWITHKKLYIVCFIPSRSIVMCVYSDCAIVESNYCEHEFLKKNGIPLIWFVILRPSSTEDWTSCLLACTKDLSLRCKARNTCYPWVYETFAVVTLKIGTVISIS